MTNLMASEHSWPQAWEPVWETVALFIEPNPLLYTKLSHVCRSARAEFSADRLWRRFGRGEDANHMAKFFDRVDAMALCDQRALQSLWSQLINYNFWDSQDPGETPTDKDLALPWTVLKGAKLFKSPDWEVEFDDLDDLDEDEDEDEDEDDEDDEEFDLNQISAPNPLGALLKEDPMLAENAVYLWGPLLQYVATPSRELIFDALATGLGLKAPETDGHALRFAGDQAGDVDVVRAAILNDPLSFEFAAQTIRNSPADVLPLARLDGNVLAFASVEIRNNKAVLLEAVQATGYGLAYASHALKGDRELVMASVSVRGASLRDALPRWRIDDEVIAAAVANDPLAIQYIPEDIDELREKLGVKYKPPKENPMQPMLDALAKMRARAAREAEAKAKGT